MKSYHERLVEICKSKNIEFKKYISSVEGKISPLEQDINSSKFKNNFNFLILLDMKKLNFKGAVLFKNKSKLKIINLQFVDKLKRGQVLVKLKYSGICGKQIDEIDGIGGKDEFFTSYVRTRGKWHSLGNWT